MGLVTSLLLSLGVQLAQADPVERVVSIDCFALSESERSEIEARQLGDWMVRGIGSGQLLLTCEQERVRGLFLGPSGSESKAAEMKHHGEDDLSEVVQLVAMSVFDAVGSQAPAASPAAPTETPATNQAPSDAAPAHAQQDPLSKDVAHEPLRIHPPPTVALDRYRMVIGAALQFNYFGTQPTGSLGPRIALAVRRLRWGVMGQFSYQVPLLLPEGLRIREMSFDLQALVSPTPWLNFCVGPTLSSISLRSSQPLVADAQQALHFGITAQAEFVHRFTDRWALAVALGGRFLSARVRVAIDAEHVVTVPQWQGISSLGVWATF